MDLSTVLILSLFFYGLFLILLAIEYITDKRKKQRAPPQKVASHNTQKPEEKERVRHTASESEQLEDIEKSEREEPKFKKNEWRKWIDIIFACEDCVKTSTGVQPCEYHKKVWDELIGVSKEEKSPEAPAIWKEEEFE